MFEISVSGWFAAAHQLRLAHGGLEPIHGHNWRVSATFRGPRLDSCGMLIDFTVIKPRLDAVLAELHDRHLNELPAFATLNPSAENVARSIAHALQDAAPAGVRLASVEVEEAPGCVARYFPDASSGAADADAGRGRP